MPVEVSIPRLGWSMEEGVFAGWLKQPGEPVRAGEPLFMLEGEKATQEIESIGAGVLHVAPDGPAVGQTVLVGRIIGLLCAAGEEPSWPAAAPSAKSQAARPPQGPPPASGPASGATRSMPAAGNAAPRPQPVGDPATVPRAASPTVRRLARQLGIDLSRVTPAWPGGRIAEHDLLGAAASQVAPGGSGRIVATPRARRLAQERGVDLGTVRGSGRGGRVRERDVLGARPAPAADRAPPPGAIPVTATRRTIARLMVKSRQETVPVTLTAWADASALLAARKAAKKSAGDAAATFNDMLLKVLADLLVAHPLLGARWEETFLVPATDRVDIGLAVDAPAGLVVPVVRDVGRASLAEVAGRTRDLVERARAGRLSAADMQGGVFTLSSLGGFGVEFFTPVINWPESAILGVGAIRQQPVPAAAGGSGFAFQPQLPLSLTFDHRVVDGAPAARFLADLVTRIAAFPAGA